MNQMMSALRIHDWKTPPVLQRIPVPEPSKGESLVRIEAAGVTHLDLTVLSGDFGLRPQLPYTGGVEGAGAIVQSGRFAPGTQVAIRNSRLGLSRDGAWAEYAAVPDDDLVALSTPMPPELAAFYFDPLGTAYVAIHDVLRLGSWVAEPGGTRPIARADEVVAVAGAAGAVGSAAVQLALREGARVIGLVSRAESAPHVPKGAEVVILSDADALERLQRERPFSAVIDTIGGPNFARRLGWIRPGGRAAVIGYTAGIGGELNLPNWLLSDVALLPVNMMHHGRRAQALDADFVALIASGEVHLRTEILTMDVAERAVPLLRSGEVRGRLIIKP